MRQQLKYIIGLFITIAFHSCTNSNGFYTITEARPIGSTDVAAAEVGNKLIGKKINITWFENTVKIEINGHEPVALYKQSEMFYTGKGSGVLGTDDYTLKVDGQNTNRSQVQIDILSHTEPSHLSTMGTTFYDKSERFNVLAKHD